MKTKRGESVNSNSMNKVLLKQNYLKKLNIILNELPIIEKETYNLIRNFFKEYLNLDYEFTNEEMKKELKQVYFSSNIKKRIGILFDTLSKIEYSSQSLSQSQLNSILSNFKSIINDLVVVHYQEELSFVQQMQHSLQTFLTNKKNLLKKKRINKNSVGDKVLIESKGKEINIPLSNDNMKSKESLREEIEQSPSDISIPIEESKESISTKEIKKSTEYPKGSKLIVEIKPKKIKKNKINQIKDKKIKKESKDNRIKKSSKIKKQKSNRVKIKIPIQTKKITIEDQIDQNLKKLNSLVNKDFNKAKLLYFTTLRLYNSLGDTKKDRHFEEIQKAYTKLQNKSK